MICNCCNIDKEDKNFQTYWHSTQNKFRTRKECTECLYKKRKKNNLNRLSIPTEIVQPVVPESQPEPIIDFIAESNPDYTRCKICLEHKPNEEFYISKGKVVGLVCKGCELEKNRKDRLEYIQNNCGSEFVWSEVGKYADEYQKACTFNFMRQLGYLYDENTGIWTKPGWKEIKDGKPFFPHIVKRRLNGRRLKPEEKLKILELREKGLTYDEIALELQISDTTVYKYVKAKAH